MWAIVCLHCMHGEGMFISALCAALKQKEQVWQADQVPMSHCSCLSGACGRRQPWGAR